MKIYLAPLEGITGYIFRSGQLKYFGGVDKYFTPFISPSEKGTLGTKVFREILPENNVGQNLVPQILTNNSQGFITMCKALAEYGYKEFNLNLGCPSGTVVSKGRGAGFLQYTDELDKFLDEIFSSDFKISIKTRIGMENSQEFIKLLEIYNKYPMTELIIHPRTRKDMYKNKPDWEAFKYAVDNSKNKLCYNGDIFDIKDYENFKESFPNCDCLMLGRGIIINPSLPLEIRGNDCNNIKAMRDFCNYVYDSYSEILSGNMPLIHKMKELLLYMVKGFEDSDKVAKKIKKAKNISELNGAMEEMFSLNFKNL